MSDNAKPTFSAALFDMDGLLLDTENIVNQCLKQTALHFGITDMDDTFLAMIGFRGDDSDAMLERGLDGRVDLKTFCIQADKLVEERFLTAIPVKPGVIRLLESLKLLGLPCAVASSTLTDKVELHLQQAGIRDFFSTITGGDQVVQGKPWPDIYHKAAASIHVSAGDCIAFEDSEPGTLAALAAGATVVQVPDLIAPSAPLKQRGHIIAEDIWHGAVRAGLVR